MPGDSNWKKRNIQTPNGSPKLFKRQTFISDVFRSAYQPSFYYIRKKKPTEGKDYLLKATINFDTFNSLAENLRFGKTGFAFILNKKGEFQTKPHYEMLPIDKSYPDFVKHKRQITTGYLRRHV